MHHCQRARPTSNEQSSAQQQLLKQPPSSPHWSQSKSPRYGQLAWALSPMAFGWLTLLVRALNTLEECHSATEALVRALESLQDMVAPPELHIWHIAELHRECRLEGYGRHKGPCKGGDPSVFAGVCSPGGGAQGAVQAAEQLLQRRILLEEALVRCHQPDSLVVGACCIIHPDHAMWAANRIAYKQGIACSPCNLLRCATTR